MSTEAKPLPELHQSVFDEATLEVYIADLNACTEILVVMPKAGPGYVAPKSIQLEEGAQLLLAGKLRGLQIRYRYQNEEWWDTLINREGQIHITRIQQNFN
jgi:hypothetical protein